MKVNRADATFFVNEIRQQMLNSGVVYIDHAISRFAPVMSPDMRAAVPARYRTRVQHSRIYRTDLRRGHPLTWV